MLPFLLFFTLPVIASCRSSLMSVLDAPLLSILIFLPLVGAVLIVFLPANADTAAKSIALLVSAVVFLISLPLYWYYNPDGAAFQFVEQHPWIPSWGIAYYLGLDGLSLMLVLLTTLLSFLAVLGAWAAVEQRVKGFMLCLLVLETTMLGVFCALDVFLFYLFWEILLFPMYFLVGIWGGQGRLYASIKFVLYTMSASVLMLIAILFMGWVHYKQSGQWSFSLLEWWQTEVPLRAQPWLFGAFFLAFSVKAPLFPLHTWLPDAHVEAPTAGSVILAGVLLKMGVYGILRFNLPLFSQVALASAPYLTALATVGVIYGALVCMVQPDMKKLVAYSSVSHMAMVMLGVFSLNLQGLQGGVLQMLNHGITTGALFTAVGMVYERRHTRAIVDYGGLMQVMPVFTALFLLVTFASIGLPGLNGFVGEFLILIGAFRLNAWAAVVSAAVVILAAVYMLWMVQRVFFGKVGNVANQGLKDLGLREIAVLLPMVVFIVWVGIQPGPFLRVTEPSVKRVLHMMKTPATLRAQLLNPAPMTANR